MSKFTPEMTLFEVSGQLGQLYDLLQIFNEMQDENKIPASEVSVTLNGKSVDVNWDDSEKTSYTLVFEDEGDNIVKISVGKTVLTYTIHYIPAAPGEKIGKVVFSVEALTLGDGFIIEPCYVDILAGENGAQMLDRLLTENDFTYKKTGSLEKGFYLSCIEGAQLESIDVNGDTISAELRKKLEENRFTISARDDADSLGEFDYTYGSGWMISVNNVFPNVGFSDIHPTDGDVLRLQFTLAYGSDVGSGWGGNGFFQLADKGALMTKVVEVNAEIEKNAA